MIKETPDKFVGLSDFYTALFEALPSGNLLLQANPPHYTILAGTPLHLTFSGLQKEDVIGKELFEIFPSNPEDANDTGESNLKASLDYVIQKKEPHQLPVQRYDVVDDTGRFVERYWKAENKPVLAMDGAVAYIIHTTEDVTERVKAGEREEAHLEFQNAYRRIEESGEKYRNLFESMDQGYCTLEIIFEGEQCIDYRYLETNPTFERHVGLNRAIGKTIRELAPDIEPKWFDFYGSVALTGNPIRVEEESKALNKWLEVYAVRVGSADERKVGVFFSDITKRKASELSLNDNQELLRTVFDAAPNSLTVYEEIYDNEGKIEDFKFVIVNEFTVQTTGRADLVGKLYGEEFPYVRQTGVLEIFKNVATNGLPADFEKWYEGEGMRHWFRFIVNKIGKLLVVTTEDITKRKQAETEIQESEAKFRLMAESTPVLIAVGDEAGNATYFNKAWIAQTGRPMQDLLKMGWGDLVHPDDKDRHVDTYLDAFTVKEPFTGEFRVLNPKGEYCWLLVHGVPRYTTDGSFVGYISACTDVTKQKESQQELQTALEQVRLSKEAAELGTFDMDLEKGTMDWDNRCRTLFGISHHGPVTYEKDFVDGLHSDDRERILRVIDQVFIKSIKNGEYDVEYRTVGAEDGVIRWVRAKGKVYFNNQEKPIRFIGSVLDITEKAMAIQKIERLVEERTTELAQANETLQIINKELQRSNQNLEEFAHAASHDLKEPIRKIHFFTQQLREQLSDRLKENEKFSFGRIENATERMGNLIDDLLLYSHVSQRPHETEAIDLNVKVQRVLEDLELDIKEKGAVINVGELPVIQGYRRQLQQLFQNLISNAVKYSKANVPPYIHIRAEKAREDNRNYHVISVQDNGIGFDQQYEDKIFQMFARLHGKSEYNGTGVGLSIVKKVVENHKGFIRVKSEPGAGSTFKIYLPV